MVRALPLLLALVFALRGETKSACPVVLVSGAEDQDTISVTFRNVGKVPIRRLEFNCQAANPRAKAAAQARCYEPNASFLPVGEYTVSYGIPGGSRATVLVSVKAVTFSDGHTFKPTKRDPCRVLTIKAPRPK
ncbi:MAG TPA: hypothetical protein VI488_12555 [Candidatus Angelobacter sp.]